MKLQDSDREHAIQLLSAHYAQGALSTHELEARFERVYAVRDTDGLRALFDGLPQLPAAIELPRGMYSVAPANALSDEKRIFCLMAEAKRRGEWMPARRNVVKVIMGKVTIDLREALLAPGAITDFDVFAFMGEVLFIVPPGVAVHCEGMPIMGSFDDSSSLSNVAPDAPRIRINGTALMGGVKVRTRLPGESALAAWRRQFSARSR